MTVAAIPVEKEFASEFGVIETTPERRISASTRREPDAPTMPGDPRQRLCVDGQLHLLDRTLLLRELYADAKRRQLARFRHATYCRI